jgi:hypothetical protein
VPYEGSLRHDLFEWLKIWGGESDLCLALGTSMSGFNCDSVPAAVGYRYLQERQGLGLVIVNLQETPYDEVSSLRIFAKTDEVFAMLLEEMNITASNEVYKVKAANPRQLAQDRFEIPFDEHGNPVSHSQKHRFITWDLRIGSKVRVTGGPYEGDVGTITEKNVHGDYKIVFENSIHPGRNVSLAPSPSVSISSSWASPLLLTPPPSP